MNKRGQSENLSSVTKEVFFVILAIVIFLIFLGAKFLPTLIGQSDEEICRLSILTRATSPEVTQRLLPLKCTAKKICFSEKGEDCPQFLGEKNVQNIKLPTDSEKAGKLIAKTTAEEWYTCWSVTGKGKLDIFPKGGTGSTIPETAIDLATETFYTNKIYPKCVICSRIALSPKIENNNEILQKIDVNKYMVENKVPGSSYTFLEEMTDRQFSSYPQEFQDKFGRNNNYNTNPTNQVAIVFMQMIVGKETPFENAIRSGTYTGIGVGSTLLSTVAGKVTGVFGGASLTGLASIISGVGAYFRTQENQALAISQCGALVSAKGSANEASYGCSIVTPMAFNTTKMNDFCNGGIEGKI